MVLDPATLLIKDTLLSIAIISMLILTYALEKHWYGRSYYCTTMLKLNSNYSILAFGTVFISTVFSTLGVFFITQGNDRLAGVAFNMALLFWGLFFFIINIIINREGSQWLPGFQ